MDNGNDFESSLFGDELPKTVIQELTELSFPVYIRSGNSFFMYRENGDCALISLKQNGNSIWYGNNFRSDETLENIHQWILVFSQRKESEIISSGAFESANDLYNEGMEKFFTGEISFHEEKGEENKMPKMKSQTGGQYGRR